MAEDELTAYRCSTNCISQLPHFPKVLSFLTADHNFHLFDIVLLTPVLLSKTLITLLNLRKTYQWKPNHQYKTTLLCILTQLPKIMRPALKWIRQGVKLNPNVIVNVPENHEWNSCLIWLYSDYFHTLIVKT